MGLDKPMPEQLVLYLYDVGRGNLGRSMTTGQPVTKDLRERLPASLELTFTALLIALVSAVPLGVLAALRPGSVDRPRRAVVLHARRLRADLRLGAAC